MGHGSGQGSGHGSGQGSGQGSAPTRSVRVRIEGRVQGVGFRYWVEQQAARLALSGFVRNRRDGSVEALLCGPPHSVAEMLERCRVGPPAAGVTAVGVLEDNVAAAAPRGFRVLPTA
jgi:acylphosphatase